MMDFTRFNVTEEGETVMETGEDGVGVSGEDGATTGEMDAAGEADREAVVVAEGWECADSAGQRRRSCTRSGQ